MFQRRSSLQSNDLFAREIDIEVCLKTLKIFQKLEGDVNCVVWDASLVLAKYLESMCQSKPEFLSGMRVLELGAGLGVVGLTAATLGAQVTLTDLPEALTLLRMNINENKSKISSMGGYAIAESLVWGDSSSEIFKEEFDMIVLADCVYYEEALIPLIETLHNFTNTRNKEPIIYMTQELRDTEVQKKLWKTFYEKVIEIFNVEKVPEEEQHVNYRSSDITLLRINKKVDSKEYFDNILKFTMADGWLIGRSKKHNGQIYYFNTLTGHAVWNLSDAEIEKAQKTTRKLEALKGSKLLDECPEPKEPPVYKKNLQNYKQPAMPSTSRDTSTQIINNKYIQPFTPFNAILCSPCIRYANPNPVGLNMAPTYNPNIWAVPPQQLFITPPPVINRSENSVNINYNQLDSSTNADTKPLSDRFTKLNERRDHYPDREKHSINRFKSNNKYRHSNQQQYRQNHRTFQHSQKSDLRHVLIARRRKSHSKSVIQMKQKQEEEDEEQDMSIEDTPAPTEEIHEDEFNTGCLENELLNLPVSKFALDVAPLKKLAGEYSNTEKWYLVADTDVYLNHFNYLNILFNSDPQCHLMVPPIIMSELKAAQGGNSKLLDWARLASSFLEKQIKAGYAVIGKDNSWNVKNLQIIHSCKTLVDENYHVVLISNDITLKSYRLQKTFPIFTISEVKDFLLNSANRPKPIEKFIEIIIPNDMHSDTHEKSIANPSESALDSSVEVTKVSTHGTENIQTSARNKTTIDACIQTDFTLAKTKITEDNVESSTKRVQENCQTNCTSELVSKLGTKIRLKRNISNEPITGTNERKGFKWRRRRQSNYNATSTNIAPDTNDESNVIVNIHSDINSLNDVEYKITNENSESSSVIQNTNTTTDKVLVEETSTSGIISNSESYVESELNFSWLRTNSFENMRESHENSNIVMFEVKDDTMAEYLNIKCDEWVSRFVQIMEEVLSQILQLDPPFVNKNLPPPWTIHEATECVKKKFEYNKDVFGSASKLSRTLFNISDVTGRIRRCLKPAEYMEMYSYGVYLVSRLQVVIPNSEDLHTAEESLSNLIRDIRDPNMGSRNTDSLIDNLHELSQSISAANFSMIEKEDVNEESTRQNNCPLSQLHDLRAKRNSAAQESIRSRLRSTPKPNPMPTSLGLSTTPALSTSSSMASSPLKKASTLKKTTSSKKTLSKKTTPSKKITPEKTSTKSITPAKSTPLAKSTTPEKCTTLVKSTTPAKSTTHAKSTTPAKNTTPAKRTTPAKKTTLVMPGTPSGPLSPNSVQFVRNIDVADAFFHSLQLQKSNNTQQSVLNVKNHFNDYSSQKSDNCINSAVILDQKSSDNLSSDEISNQNLQSDLVTIVRKFTKNDLYEEKLKNHTENDPVDYDELDYIEDYDGYYDEYIEDELDYEEMPVEDEVNPNVDVNVEVVKKCDEQHIDDKFDEDIKFPNDIKNARTISDTNNNNARWVIDAIAREVKATLLTTRGFCEKAKLVLKENGEGSKQRLKVKAELTQMHLQGLCESLKSSLVRETFAPNKFQELLMSCGLDISDIEEKESAAYRTVISKCLDQANALLEVVNILIDTLK